MRRTIVLLMIQDVRRLRVVWRATARRLSTKPLGWVLGLNVRSDSLVRSALLARYLSEIAKGNTQWNDCVSETPA